MAQHYLTVATTKPTTMTSTTLASSSVNPPQSQSARQSARQTRTNPSRASRTLGRSSFAFGHSSTAAGDDPAAAAGAVPHGFYPALTHFTDSVSALPREFRRHNSLLKEVDAKAWALEDNLLRLLKTASDSEPAGSCPETPAPIMGDVVRDDVLCKSMQSPGSPESRDRRLLFDDVRHTLSDLMMTADEKNHVITNANDELDRQMLRLSSVFPYIAGEISEETRLGSLGHWAYSNKSNAKAVGAERERSRRETASHKNDHAHHDTEAASRSEARREAALARRQRRAQHADSDVDDHRVTASRKGHASKVRGSGAGGHAAVGHARATNIGTVGSVGPAKRRKVERPPPVDTGAAAMERSNSGAGSLAGRANSKDVSAPETGKKRARAPNGTGGARKRNHAASVAESPILASSPQAGGLNSPRNAASPAPNAAPRPSSSRAQNHANSVSNSRQRPSSSTSNRVSNSSKTTETKFTPKDTPVRAETAPVADSLTKRKEVDGNGPNASTVSATAAAAAAAAATTNTMEASAPPSTKREDTEEKPPETVESNDQSPAPPTPATANTAPTTSNTAPAPSSTATAPAAKVRTSSKTSTPVRSIFSEPNPSHRLRQTRSTDPAPSKRSQKKGSTTAVVQTMAAASDDEESVREGDDEDDESEPRYCYCNEVSFGDMVACDNDACPREWFHLSCVGLNKPPGKNVKWYCNECKENMRRSRNGK